MFGRGLWGNKITLFLERPWSNRLTQFSSNCGQLRRSNPSGLPRVTCNCLQSVGPRSTNLCSTLQQEASVHEVCLSFKLRVREQQLVSALSRSTFVGPALRRSKERNAYRLADGPRSWFLSRKETSLKRPSWVRRLALVVVVVAALAIPATALLLNGWGSPPPADGNSESSKFGTSGSASLVSNANPFDIGVSSSVDLQRDGAVVSSVGAKPDAAGQSALSSMFGSNGAAVTFPNGSLVVSPAEPGSVAGTRGTIGSGSGNGNVLVRSSAVTHDTNGFGNIRVSPRLDELRTGYTGSNSNLGTDVSLTRLPGSSSISNAVDIGVFWEMALTAILAVTAMTITTRRGSGLFVKQLSSAFSGLTSFRSHGLTPKPLAGGLALYGA